MKTNLLIYVAMALVNFAATAAPLTESTYTEIIREVNTLSTAGNPAAAKLNDVLKALERVRTGPESRAELTAPDNTITRVGANTVFSFSDSGRTLNLEQGNLLFHAPKGIGGGTIKSGGASAAVLGTTLIVSATADGGFKVILLEGKGKVTLPNGKTVVLKAGQMVFVLPNGTELSKVMTINLERLVAGSLLIGGFNHPLPSQPLIDSAIAKQKGLIAAGGAADTGEAVGNGINTVDHGSYQTAGGPPLSKGQYSSIANSAIGGGSGGRNVSTLAFKP
ncbi:MAG: FecR domain-containing protein [Verrucomicrobiae bacterium]|nr:FecR domain-containing protein [Verrucomicrobiae bacterium]